MRRFAFRLAVVALVATVALVLALDLGTRHQGLIVELYLDLLCALVLVGLVVAARSALPASRALHRARRRPPTEKPERPQQLAWLERQVRAGRGSAVELSPQFRPVVRSIASAALLRSHGIVLDRSPDRARELLSERLWVLVRPDDPETALPDGDFRALLADLEAI